MSTINTYEVNLTKTRKFKVNIERYNSAQEMVQDCKTRPITNGRFDDKSKKTDFDSSWDGVDSYAEALDLLRNGYQPTVEKLSGAFKANKVGTNKRIAFENNVHGFAPVVPLALKGVPNSMMDMRMKPIKCKVVDVYYDMGCSAGTSVDTIIDNGQKVLGAIIELEKQGYRFNLYAMQSYNDHDSSDMVCVKVKSSDKPLDIKRISFPLTHPAFFRVIGFDWYSRMPIATYRSGYGYPFYHEVTTNAEREAFAKQALGDNAIYICGSIIKEKGIEHIKEAMKNAK